MERSGVHSRASGSQMQFYAFRMFSRVAVEFSENNILKTPSPVRFYSTAKATEGFCDVNIGVRRAGEECQLNLVGTVV